jgi:hypothetical protein
VPAWSPPSHVLPQRPRRRARRGVGLLALAALVVGSTAAAVSITRSSSPTGVVRHYFDALAAGDAPTALRYGPVPTGDHAFLTSTALAVAHQIAAMSDVATGPATVSGRTARVTATYLLTPPAAPGRPSHQSVSVGLHKHGHGWALDTTAATVRVVVSTAGHRATLAGAPVPAAPVALFPGPVPLQFDTGLLAQPPGSNYLSLASSGDVRIGPELSAAGIKAVEAGITAAFRTCLSQAGAAAASCPTTPDGERVVPGSLRGTLAGSAFTVRPQLDVDDADGMAQASGTFSVRGRYQALDFNNVASTRSGPATVSFRASVYVSAPGVVRWEQP